MVEYSTLSGTGNIQLSKRKRINSERMAIPSRLKKRFTDCSVMCNFIFHAKAQSIKTRTQRLEPLASLPTLFLCMKLITIPIIRIICFYGLTNLYLRIFANHIIILLSFYSNSFQPVWIAQTRPAQRGTSLLNYSTILLLFFHCEKKNTRDNLCLGEFYLT